MLTRGWLAPLCALAAAFVAMGTRVTLDLPAHTDSARDLLLARVCQDGVCPMLGAPTSMPGVFHGGWWVLHLAILEMLGLEPASVYALGLGLNFAAMALLGWALYRVGGTWCGLLGILVAAAGNLWMESYWTELWNPLLTPFFSTGFVVALMAAVRSGGVVPSVAAMTFLVMAIQTHPAASLLIVPWSVVVAVRFDRKPMLISAVLGVVVLALGVWLFSKDALHVALQSTSEQGFGPPVLVPSLLGAGWLWASLLMGLRFWWRRTNVAVFRFTWWPLIAGALAALVMLLAGWAFGLHPLLQDRYLAPLAPLGAASAGLATLGVMPGIRLGANPLAVWSTRLLPILLASIPLMMLPSLPRRSVSLYQWSYSQAQLVKGLMQAQGMAGGYQQALASLRAPNRGGLLLGLTRVVPVDSSSSPAADSQADSSVQLDEILNVGVSGVANCGVAEGAELLAAPDGADRWLCGYRSTRHLDWSRVWLRWGESEGEASWYPFTLQPQALTQHVPSPLALAGTQLPGRTPWVEAWIPVVGPFARPVRLVATGGCETDAQVHIVTVLGLQAEVVTQQEVVVWAGNHGAAPQQSWVLVRFLPTQGEMLADHQIQPAIWEGPADAPAFNLFLESVSCPQAQPQQRDYLTVSPPPATQIPRPSQSAVSPACSGTFGVACLQLHTLSPIRFPFTVAVLLYLISVLAAGWAWAVSLRVLSSSEWTEKR